MQADRSEGSAHVEHIAFKASPWKSTKQKFKHHLGVEEDEPESVSVKDFLSSHKQDVRPAVRSSSPSFNALLIVAGLWLH